MRFHFTFGREDMGNFDYSSKLDCYIQWFTIDAKREGDRSLNHRSERLGYEMDFYAKIVFVNASTIASNAYSTQFKILENSRMEWNEFRADGVKFSLRIITVARASDLLKAFW